MPGSPSQTWGFTSGAPSFPLLLSAPPPLLPPQRRRLTGQAQPPGLAGSSREVSFAVCLSGGDLHRSSLCLFLSQVLIEHTRACMRVRARACALL